MKYIYGVIIAIVLFVSGIIVGKYKFSTKDIQVIEKIEYQTKWKTEFREKIVYKDKKPEFSQENFNIFYESYQAPIHFKDRTEKNYLFVTAYTPYKEAIARYEIGTKGNWKYYLIWAGIGMAAGGAALWYFTK